MANARAGMHDDLGVLRVAEKLITLTPNDSDVLAMQTKSLLSRGYLFNGSICKSIHRRLWR